MIHVQMPSKVASSMLQTEFAYFRNTVERNVVLPRVTKPYSLPREIAEVVSIVDDIMRFPAMRSSPRAYGVDSAVSTGDEFSSCGTSCNGFTTPAVLQARYGYPSMKAATAGNSMSVAEFQYQYCKKP
jgi:hypothetical protein